jgi:hypothetical protein
MNKAKNDKSTYIVPSDGITDINVLELKKMYDKDECIFPVSPDENAYIGFKSLELAQEILDNNPFYAYQIQKIGEYYRVYFHYNKDTQQIFDTLSKYARYYKTQFLNGVDKKSESKNLYIVLNKNYNEGKCEILEDLQDTVNNNSIAISFKSYKLAEKMKNGFPLCYLKMEKLNGCYIVHFQRTY